MQIEISSKLKFDKFNALVLGVCEKTVFEDKLIDTLLFKTRESNFENDSWSTLYNENFLHITFVKLDDKEEEVYIADLVEQIRKLKKKKITHLGIDFNACVEVSPNPKRTQRRLVEQTYLASNEGFNLKQNKDANSLENVTLVFEEKDESVINEALVLAEMTQLARRLVNLPPNKMTPSILANEAVELGASRGFEVEILEEKHIEALKMEAYLSVAKGSAEKPQLIIMRYHGNSKEEKRFGLVGKGLTYDSGGYSIKPTDSMVNMKNDMGGAAAVIGAMGAIASMKLPYNVTAVVAACENMISGTAYRPGDIIGSMSGKTIYVANTDAEGRLTLADAIYYIQTIEKVDMLIDIATLTGAAVYSFGDSATPVVTNDETLYKVVEKSFSKSIDLVWKMPNLPEYHKQVKHELADLTNSGGRPGVMTAAAFLEAFVIDRPWVHIDIAATAFLSKEKGMRPSGATGIGVMGLYHTLKKLSK